MNYIKKTLLIFIYPVILSANIPLFWFKPKGAINFGDALSPMIIERIINKPLISSNKNNNNKQCLLSLGSILHFAKDNDVIWGTGLNGKTSINKYKFKALDVRAIRGPLTRNFLLSRGINCPKIYGDPALLMPLLFPELKPHPIRDFIVIPNLNEIKEFNNFPNLILPIQEPMIVVKEILKSKLVISGSLHGIIVAEAFGIPARLLKITNKESIVKYKDYYLATGRKNFKAAKSIKEAIEMGGEAKPIVNLKALLNSFPKDKF